MSIMDDDNELEQRTNVLNDTVGAAISVYLVRWDDLLQKGQYLETGEDIEKLENKLCKFYDADNIIARINPREHNPHATYIHLNIPPSWSSNQDSWVKWDICVSLMQREYMMYNNGNALFDGEYLPIELRFGHNLATALRVQIMLQSRHHIDFNDEAVSLYINRALWTTILQSIPDCRQRQTHINSFPLTNPREVIDHNIPL